MLLPPPHTSAGELFRDDFNRGIPGWTAVEPPGAYLAGPLRWEYDIVSGAFVEQSNIYTDSATYSPTATTPMLINDAVTAVNFTFSARLTAGDDDGFGLIFGYHDDNNFYRVCFARQSRTGFPWTGWCVDRKVNGLTINLFGAGTPGYVQTFVNTTARPFDVTITVDTANQLTLTVVDNPTGTSATYHLVNSQVLPSAANGKTGFFTWGMSGAVPHGFRIQNPTLYPVGLSGAPDTLTNWTALVPPRGDGSTTVGSGQGVPMWALALGEGGPSGTLRESSDCYAGNDTLGQVDFTGPTLVAGDEAWTNYTVAVRVLPGDDDAHGILLRYQDPENFYRIALRSQNSTIGPPRGLSIQRNINRVYTQVFRESAVQYDPLPGVPYDLVASINGNVLEVLLVADPEGNRQFYSYGPFTISGLSHGKIGLFSWAMSQTDFDFVSVQDGTPLFVSSPYGSPDPPTGLNGFAPGTLVQASVTAAESEPGVRRFPDGFVGSGSVPASGTGTNITFRIEQFSQLEWLWRTEYQLSVTNEPGGTVSFPAGEWFAASSSISVSAQPDPGYAFAGWRGDSLSTAAQLSLIMNQPYHLTATFTPDTDMDGLPDSWEMTCFGSLDPLPGDDPDGDGRTNAEEYQDGTNPLAADIFRIADIHVVRGVSVLTISNNTGTRYNVERAVGLPANWTTVGVDQFGNTFSSSLPAGDRAFWRLQQPARPADALPFVPGSWTLVVLPDTQVYSQSYPELFKDQMRWILANRERHNIKYVLHLGDLTNNNTPDQWANARAAMSMLDGVVPYALAPGNHDYGPSGGCANRTTYLNDYFPPANYLSWPTLGGLMDSNRMDNSYHLFSAGGVDWLILALEFGPRNSVVAWAQSILDRYPDRRVILITHAYLYDDNTRYDWATKGTSQRWNPYAYGTASDPDGTNDGEDLWNKLVKNHPNFVLVINGHVLNDGLGRLDSTNDFGQVVHQMLVNYQIHALGGEAFLRLIEFLPDGRTVQVRAYSPLYGTYKTDPQNQFTLELQPPL